MFTLFKPKYLSPLLVILVSLGIAKLLSSSAPQAEKRSTDERAKVSVEAITLGKTDYPVIIETSGTVKPRTEGTVVPQIGGTIMSISPRFRDGAFFEAGELLVQIDDRDYQAAAIVAESAFREAELRIAEEQARVSQAVRDWKRLGHNDAPSDLVLRKPQLAAAQAAVASAKAHVSMAHLNLERTQIKAPYAGRVMSKKVDVGQVVNVGTVLAEIYAVDYVEIRLPLTNQQVEFVDLPERYRNASNESGSDAENTTNGTSSSPKVILSARIGRQNYQWAGYIARTEGAIDVRSRQLFVVAQVNDPYGENQEGRPPLKIGQFVTAKINGKTLRGVYVIPRAALYQNNEIVLVKAQKILRQSVNIVWQSAEEVVIEGEFDEGDLLTTTPMNNVINGTDVEKVILNNKTEAAFSVASPVTELIPTTKPE